MRNQLEVNKKELKSRAYVDEYRNKQISSPLAVIGKREFGIKPSFKHNGELKFFVHILFY